MKINEWVASTCRLSIASSPRWRRFWLLFALVLGMMVLLPSTSQAQNCSGNSFGIAFGTVSNAANTDATGSLSYQCQGNGDRTYFKLCFFMSGGTTPGTEGINPRRMTNYNNSTVAYQLYSDSARTQIIGPPPAGNGYPLFTWDYVANGWSNPTRTQTVYGRVPPVPAGTAAGNYQAQGGSLVLQYAWNNASPPSDCFQSAGGGVGAASVGYSGSTATVSNSCTVALSRPQDLDFGSHASLPVPVLSTTAISLACPNNLSWKIGLNNGVNASDTQRRMKNAAGNYIPYELYRDSARSLRWGNDVTGGTDTVSGSGSAQTNPTVLTVYGRVPAQGSVAAGAYVDTITVTLSY